MAGAWELSGPDTLVCTLTRELVTTRWASSFRQMELPPNSMIRFLAGAPYDHARNLGCEEALSGGYQWVFMLDDDVIMPPNGIQILKSSRQPIVSGLYFRRHEPVCPVALQNSPDGTRNWITGYQPGTIFPADYVGAGCLLIHRSVLEKMPSPWFEWWSDRKDLPKNEQMSEDFSFCHKARKLGFPIYVDTRVECLHAGLASAGTGGLRVLGLS
jgi:hypothetical protein